MEQKSEKPVIDKTKVIQKTTIQMLVIGFLFGHLITELLWAGGKGITGIFGSGAPQIFILVCLSVFISLVLGNIIGNFIYRNRQAESDEKYEKIKQKEEAAALKLRESKVKKDLLYASEMQVGVLEIIDSLPEILETAELSIQACEVEFKEGAFSPFWDHVEAATNKIAEYQVELKDLTQTVVDYSNHKKGSESNEIPSLIFDDQSIPDGRELSERLGNIVRNAQKDFQFASIFEQRKTNQLLYEGFGTLANSLSEMGSRLQFCISEFGDTLNANLNEAVGIAKKQLIATQNLEDATHKSAAVIKSSIDRNTDETRRSANEVSRMSFLNLTELTK